VGSIDRKKQRAKISGYCPFKSGLTKFQRFSQLENFFSYTSSSISIWKTTGMRVSTMYIFSFWQLFDKKNWKLDMVENRELGIGHLICYMCQMRTADVVDIVYVNIVT
jgi:hypothetical protein